MKPLLFQFQQRQADIKENRKLGSWRAKSYWPSQKKLPRIISLMMILVLQSVSHSQRDNPERFRQEQPSEDRINSCVKACPEHRTKSFPATCRIAQSPSNAAGGCTKVIDGRWKGCASKQGRRPKRSVFNPKETALCFEEQSGESTKEISWQNYRKADFEFSHWTHGICLSKGSTSWQLSTCISGFSTNMIGVVVDVDFIHKCEINLRDNLWMFILSRGMKESYQDPPDSSRHAMIAIRTERVAGYSGICIPWVRRRTTHPLQVCKGFSTDRVDETVRPRKSTFPNLHHIFRRELRNPSPAVKYNVGSAGLLIERILINNHAFNCNFSWTWPVFVYCSWYCDFICNLISETN